MRRAGLFYLKEPSVNLLTQTQMLIQINKAERRVGANNMTPGAIVGGVLYDTKGTIPLAKLDYYIVTHQRALVSLTTGVTTTDGNNPVTLVGYTEYDGILSLTTKA